MNLCETTKCVKKIQKITLGFSRQVVFWIQRALKLPAAGHARKCSRRQRGFFETFKTNERKNQIDFQNCVCESQLCVCEWAVTKNEFFLQGGYFVCAQKRRFSSFKKKKNQEGSHTHTRRFSPTTPNVKTGPMYFFFLIC